MHVIDYKHSLESSCPLKKSTERINGVVATIMGFDRAILSKNNTGAPVYDDVNAQKRVP